MPHWVLPVIKRNYDAKSLCSSPSTEWVLKNVLQKQCICIRWRFHNTLKIAKTTQKYGNKNHFRASVTWDISGRGKWSGQGRSDSLKYSWDHEEIMWRVIVCWDGKAQKTWILVLGHSDETGSAGSLTAGMGLSRWPCPTHSICKKGHTEIQKADSLVLCHDCHESQHWAWHLSPALSSLFPDLLPSTFMQPMVLWGPWDPGHVSMSTIFQLLSDYHCKDRGRHCPSWAWILKNQPTNHSA